jgi:hypothetical protein
MADIDRRLLAALSSLRATAPGVALELAVVGAFLGSLGSAFTANASR